MDSDLLLRTFLATFFICLAVAYSAKQAALSARDGDPRVHYGDKGSTQRGGRLVFNVFRTAIFAAMILRAPFPEIDPYLGALAIDVGLLNYFGAGLMLIGLWVVFYAHNYMGELWRSGVAPLENWDDQAGGLLQKGPFGRSRNPIFLGVQLAQLGFFFAFPSVFTAICLIACVLVLHRQVRIEERDLEARFGPSYLAYASRTPRWV